MKILNILILLCCLSPFSIFAHEGAADDQDSSKSDYELRILQTIELSKNQIVYLTARDEGHVLGQPFVVETRVSCTGPANEVKALAVKDSYSVCDMQPVSIKLNLKKTAVAMKYKAADIATYYKAIEDGQALSDVPCQGKTELLKFSLKNLCP